MSMKATDTNICPYTGLRSFTEDESLYFKGREEQVDHVTAQLEQRKFLMLTGASGEGKSSLIYAGLIPNARAGFFKAKYANWTVVDFRPERSPVNNISRALANAFQRPQNTIETEIRRGFSSLADLYRNSDLYINEQDESWQSLPAAEKKTKTRSASNLLILIDQFEEFFTNPENYFNETPSQDSQILVNLVLETARIAIQQDLPIYVVCTMRSDYIGQCSSFRGLAEYIGYSQFFVPRLKRKELKQVIEEPAMLSGNRITQRLADRLVYDLSEGVDQLPILQHALSQIWLMASHGDEEMDLVHYAMVGGMPASELPDEGRHHFETWFATLPDYQKQFYETTGLDKVIENQANRLYESASSVYNAQHPGHPISGKDAKNIIALTFSCLTRIDNSRAVRNRMTLGEITAIINRPEITPTIVGKVIDIFREEGNSFIRPFKDNVVELSVDTVLDITHESLIRNWGKLRKWASNEYAYYNTFIDLRKQLERWKQNGKRSGYLLPVGPLTYFENWYATSNPNTGWINRYAERSADPSLTWKESENILNDIREYLRKSANHVRITRAFMKYGASNIAVGIAAAIALVLCVWYAYEGNQKKNENVVAQVREAAIPLLKSRDVDLIAKSNFLITEERLEPGSANAFIETVSNRNDRMALSNSLYRRMALADKRYDEVPLKKQLLDRLDRDLDLTQSADGSLFFEMQQANDFIYNLAFDNYYNPGRDPESKLREQATELYPLIVRTFTDSTRFNASLSASLNQSIQNWLTFGVVSEQQVRELLNIISPASGDHARRTFDFFYPRGSYEPNGLRPINYKGGYHTLASLYAAIGDTEKIKWCFDQLSDQPDYFAGKLLNDYTTIIGYLYQYAHGVSAPEVAALVQKYFPSNNPATVYRDVIIRSGYLTHLYRIDFFPNTNRGRSEDGILFLNLTLSDRKQFMETIADYEKILGAIQDPDERNYLLAMHFKRVAMYESKYSFDRKIPLQSGYLDAYFDKAWSHFTKVSEAYLAETISLEYNELARLIVISVTRRESFIYPDYRGSRLSMNSHTDAFYNYMERKGLLTQAFRTAKDFEQLHYWLASIEGVIPFRESHAMFNMYRLSDSLLFSIERFVTGHTAGQGFDTNLLYMIMANRAFSRADTTAGVAYFRKVNFETLDQSGGRYLLVLKTTFRNTLMQLAKNLGRYNHVTDAVRVIERLESVYYQQIAYTEAAAFVYDESHNPDAFILLDSANSKWVHLDNPSVPDFLEFRSRFIRTMEKIGGDRMIALAREQAEESAEQRRVFCIGGIASGSCERGDFYHAAESIPPSLTETEDLRVKTIVVLFGARAREKRDNQPPWAAVDNYFSVDYIQFLGFAF